MHAEHDIKDDEEEIGNVAIGDRRYSATAVIVKCHGPYSISIHIFPYSRIVDQRNQAAELLINDAW
jgi:hypothetical protein